MDEVVLRAQLPVEGRGVAVVVPYAVEPDGADFPVAREQLGQLCVHKRLVLLPILLIRGSSGAFSRASERVVGSSPVEVRVVEVQGDAVSLAGLAQLLENVALEGCRLDGVVVAGRRVPQRETVVVARGDGDVLRAASLDGLDPLVGVEQRGIERGGEFRILLIVDVAVLHHPFALSEHRVEAPVQEDAEFLVLKLRLCLFDGLGRLVNTLRCNVAEREKQYYLKNQSFRSHIIQFICHHNGRRQRVQLR